MKQEVIISLLFLIVGAGTVAQAQKGFDESIFYEAIASNDLTLVDNQLKTISKLSIKEKEAYEGVLLMKRAALVTKPRSKLSSFREGHAKLQEAISKDPGNGIYRFLRLMIQENAPAILNYNDNIDEDSKMIREVFDTLPPVVRNSVIDYGKKSKALHVDRLKA
jgi:hypothetical protein